MARKFKSEEAGSDETWLIPYADILTLLLALFIVLFAMSSVDESKYDALMQALNQEFGGASILDDSGEATGPVTAVDILPPDIQQPAPEEGGEDSGQGSVSINELYGKLSEDIKANNLEGDIGVEQNGDTVTITLKNDIMFASGSADLTEEMREAAKMLAAVLQDTQDPANPFSVIVNGHTDNVPISGGVYKSNWELSLFRAVMFMEELLADTTLDPKYFNCRGYGEYEPIDTNDTPEGRQKNRRVEVLVSQTAENVSR